MQVRARRKYVDCEASPQHHSCGFVAGGRDELVFPDGRNSWITLPTTLVVHQFDERRVDSLQKRCTGDDIAIVVRSTSNSMKLRPRLNTSDLAVSISIYV